jgi:hypothetical protein
MEQRTDRAYRLSWEYEHLEFCDNEDELNLRFFPDWEQTSDLFKTTPYELPDLVIFEGELKILPCTDYPSNNANWPVMSRRMYYTLLGLGDFSHRVIPVAIMDDRAYPFESHRCFLADGRPNPEVTNFNDFVAIQLLEESDYFDFDKSEYTRHPRDQNWIDYVDKFVLKIPDTGFPPLFRLTVKSPVLFISAKAHEALKRAGVRGTAYYPLDSLQSEVDIPVQLPTYS